MKTAIRLFTLTLMVSLIAGGPLAPYAFAQQQPAPPPQQPAPPQPQPAQPDLFQEALKASRVSQRADTAYDAGAVVVNAFLVPGRAITCVLGGAVGLVVLAGTLGSAYRAAAAAAHEGCGGKWVVTGDDLKPEPPQTRPFDWERR